MRTLRNLAYFAVGIFLAASFMLGTTQVRADHVAKINHPTRDAVAATVHRMHEEGRSCSAVMIAPERALTAAHCLFMEAPVLTIDGYDYVITEGYAASPRDVAILIVPGAPCPCARVASTPIGDGAPVMTVGYPYGVPVVVVTYGEFQGRLIFPDDGQEYLLLTALGAPGNSGGGVFNEYGELVGIVSKGAQGIFLLAVELFTMTIELR